MRKVVFLIFFFIFVLNYEPVPIFAQAKEFSRTRTGTLAGREGGYPGAESKVEYYIAPEDKIEIFVWQNPDLTKDIIVGPDGQISFPLVGRIMAAGLTIDQLEEKIRKKLSEFVKNPQVSVIVKEFSGDKIVVLGDVNYPGIYTYKGGVNLIEAIALAGDFTDEAHRESVLVIHGNLTKKPEVRRINMSKVISRGTSKEDIILKPDDVVFVPRTFISNFNKAMNDISEVVSNATNMLSIRREIRRLQRHDR